MDSDSIQVAHCDKFPQSEAFRAFFFCAHGEEKAFTISDLRRVIRDGEEEDSKAAVRILRILKKETEDEE